MDWRLIELSRNDLSSALAFAKHALAGGEWTAEIEHILVRLQEDPTELIERLVDLVAADRLRSVR